MDDRISGLGSMMGSPGLQAGMNVELDASVSAYAELGAGPHPVYGVPMHCHAPAHAFLTNTGTILVLFILLVIVSRWGG